MDQKFAAFSMVGFWRDQRPILQCDNGEGVRLGKWSLAIFDSAYTFSVVLDGDLAFWDCTQQVYGDLRGL